MVIISCPNRLNGEKGKVIRYEKTYFGSRPYDGGNDVCSRNETNAMVQ